LIYGCPGGDSTDFFLVKWHNASSLTFSRFLKPDEIQKLASIPQVHIDEKSSLKDAMFAGKFWTAYLGTNQVLSTYGLLKALEKYGSIDNFTGPYENRSNAQDHLDPGMVFGASPHAEKEFFLVSGHTVADRMPFSKSVTAEEFQMLISDPQFQVEEKFSLKDLWLENSFWIAGLPGNSRLQVLSTYGMSKALEKYGFIQSFSGPYAHRSQADGWLEDFYWGN